MPVRSLSSSVLRWPDRSAVVGALRAWAKKEAARHSGLLRLGYYGSYARGDDGVGSDVDLVAVVKDSSVSFERRPLAWDLMDLPVPADLGVYTLAEWERLLSEESRFAKVIEREAVWLFEGGPASKPEGRH